MAWQLTLNAASGPDQGSSFEYHVSDAFVFGRNGNPDLRGRWPTDERISREHLGIRPAEHGISVQEAAPGKRFLVDDKPRSAWVLKGGERLRLGASVFDVRLSRVETRATGAADRRPPPDAPTTTYIRICHLDDLELLHEIGRGSMGRVLFARDPEGRSLCVKLLRGDLDDLDVALSRFFAREIDLLGGLDHPNIVRTLYAGRGKKELFLAMEWIEGTSLEEEVTRRGALSLVDACCIGRQLLSGLMCSHEQGIVHRDIKPDNVMLRGQRGSFHVILIDFGLARVAGESGDRGITETGEGRGSYGFSALESLHDAKRVGPPADLFSVGATLRYALTAQDYFPFDENESKTRLLEVIGAQELTPLQEQRSDVPKALAHVIERSMAVKPEDRWHSAARMLERLVRAEGEVYRRLAD